MLTSSFQSAPRPLLDRHRRIFAILAGRPVDTSYLAAADDAARMMVAEAESANFRPDERRHRCGNFPALATGASYGNGHLRPMILAHATHAGMLAQLVDSECFIQLATFASCE